MCTHAQPLSRPLPKPKPETCLSWLHNRAGPVSPSLMYGGLVGRHKTATHADGWQGTQCPTLILMSFMVILCFYCSSQARRGRCGGAGGGAPHAISTWLRCIPLSILSAQALAVTYWLLWLDFYILLPGKSIQDELGEKRLPEQCNKILNSDGWKED